MKKILIIAFLFITGVCYAQVSEFFDGMDENAVKAGISKYILAKGGNISHGESYNLNVIQATEVVVLNKKNHIYNYIFNLTPNQNGTKLDLSVFESKYGKSPVSAGIDIEQKVMNNIKTSIKGRFLYGLGFDSANYTENNITYRAPKGRDSGIVITAVKYDAMKKGIIAGDRIIEINDTPIKDIPLEKYATILHAKTMSDTLNLTLKRGDSIYKVILTPRLSNNRTF